MFRLILQFSAFSTMIIPSLITHRSVDGCWSVGSSGICKQSKVIQWMGLEKNFNIDNDRCQTLGLQF